MILLDTDVLIDLALDRQPHASDAARRQRRNTICLAYSLGR